MSKAHNFFDWLRGQKSSADAKEIRFHQETIAATSLAAGRDPRPFICGLEKMANEGGMLTEQLWDADDLPAARMFRGAATGAAMPLCWSHAEYVNLVRSARDGEVFGKIHPAHERYAEQRAVSRHEMWTFRHQTRRIPRGKTLHLLVAAEATVRWTLDAWQTVHNLDTDTIGLPDLHSIDLPTHDLPAGTAVEWTFHWRAAPLGGAQLPRRNL
jgi:glucoamylase